MHHGYIKHCQLQCARMWVLKRAARCSCPTLHVLCPLLCSNCNPATNHSLQQHHPIPSTIQQVSAAMPRAPPGIGISRRRSRTSASARRMSELSSTSSRPAAVAKVHLLSSAACRPPISKTQNAMPEARGPNSGTQLSRPAGSHAQP